MTLVFTRVPDRSLIRLRGAEAMSWLQSLITRNIADLSLGEVRYGGHLSPQGRLLIDFFIKREDSGLVLELDKRLEADCLLRFERYRLRADVRFETLETEVFAVWDTTSPLDGGLPEEMAVRPPFLAERFFPDPRFAALGWRGYAQGTDDSLFERMASLPDMESVDPAVYKHRRRAFGVVEVAADGLSDQFYALEANMDVFSGVDFQKGCFVGQETTSRMRRRDGLKRRILPFTYQLNPLADPLGEAVSPGCDLFYQGLRAGEVVAIEDGIGLALIRLDRLKGDLRHSEIPLLPCLADGSGPDKSREILLLIPSWLDV